MKYSLYVRKAPQRVKDAVIILNSALKAHPKNISFLFRTTVRAPKLKDHPSIVLMEKNELGALGLINGILNSKYRIYREVDANDNIKSFGIIKVL